MINVYVKSGEAINLGREGTKGVRRVIFDFTRWAREYGEGSVQLVVMRHGDTSPYPVALTVDGEEAVWEVGAADTAIPGEGECEWQYFVGDALEKSEVYKTFVENAMGEAANEAPEAAQGWVEQVLEAAAKVETAIKKAPIIFADTWWIWDADAEEYVDTGVNAKGKNGESITIANITESEASGGANIVTFSDGKTLTVKNGKDGEDGYTPVKGKDYFDGKDGYTPQKGVDYFDGKDGKTPVKGEDYFTAKDKAEIVEQVIEEMPEPLTEWEDIGETKQTVEILAETEVTFDGGTGRLNGPIGLVAGKTYTVVWNGAEYECVAQDVSESAGMPTIAIGNGEPFGADGNGEPFVICDVPSIAAVMIMAFDGSASATLSICGLQTVINPLPEKYLPTSVPVINTAAVGQTVKITAIDADGKPTEWEAVDFPDGGAAIVDVVELPTENIDEDVFYRVVTGALVLYQDVLNAYTVHCVETLPEVGEPVTNLDQTEGHAYYTVGDGEAYGYVNETLSDAMGPPVGWYPLATLLGALGYEYKGVITDIMDDPMDRAFRLLVEYVVYDCKEGNWTSHKKIGKAGAGPSAETFNHPSNVASGSCGHAEGNTTTASGVTSHAEGMGTTASGNQSHAEGNTTTASGSYGSHAEGLGTTASGNQSHAEGERTIAASETQHVQGKFNIEDSANKYAHIVGNGNGAQRSNAHTLDWNGVGWYAGGLKVGGTGQDDAEAQDVMLAPLTAKAGQTIVVKEVDANGKPLSWETTDMPFIVRFLPDTGMLSHTPREIADMMEKGTMVLCSMTGTGFAPVVGSDGKTTASSLMVQARDGVIIAMNLSFDANGMIIGSDAYTLSATKQ